MVETLEALRDKPDPGLRLGRLISRVVFRYHSSQEYQALSTDENQPTDLELQPPTSPTKAPTVRRKLPFRRIWTANVIFTFTAHFLLAGHVGTFNSLWFVFLSTPRYVLHTKADNGTNPNASLRIPLDYEPHPTL